MNPVGQMEVILIPTINLADNDECSCEECRQAFQKKANKKAKKKTNKKTNKKTKKKAKKSVMLECVGCPPRYLARQTARMTTATMNCPVHG